MSSPGEAPAAARSANLAEPPPRLRGGPGTLALFVWKKSLRDAVGLRSSALAFMTLLSLVPLLAIISRLLARGVEEAKGPVVQLLVEILPYSETAIRAAIENYVHQAEAIGGLGLLGFLVAVFTTLFGVEDTLNQIWHAPVSNTLTLRAVSFLALLLSGPLLIGVTYAQLFLSPWSPLLVRWLGGRLATELTAFAVAWLGLTLLYRLVPNARVRWGSALRGALFAALALAGLRYGFAAYVGLISSVNWVIYGSVAAALFFVLSIQVAWWVVLLGSVVAYTHQHRRALERTPEMRPDGPEPWLGLGAVALLARQSYGKAHLRTLAYELGETQERVAASLRPLVNEGLLSRRFGRYRLQADPRDVAIASIFAIYEPSAVWLPGGALAGLGELRLAAARRERAAFGDATLADLLRDRLELDTATLKVRDAVAKALAAPPPRESATPPDPVALPTAHPRG